MNSLIFKQNLTQTFGVTNIEPAYFFFCDAINLSLHSLLQKYKFFPSTFKGIPSLLGK